MVADLSSTSFKIRDKINRYTEGDMSWFEILETGNLLDDIANLTHQRVSRMASDETLSQTDKQLYGHIVLSHGFMEFLGITGLSYFIGRSNYLKPPESKCEGADNTMWWVNLRHIYDRYVEVNEVPEDVREIGWEEFLND
jgi:hypothetical protein